MCSWNGHMARASHSSAMRFDLIWHNVSQPLGPLSLGVVKPVGCHLQAAEANLVWGTHPSKKVPHQKAKAVDGESDFWWYYLSPPDPAMPAVHHWTLCELINSLFAYDYLYWVSVTMKKTDIIWESFETRKEIGRAFQVGGPIWKKQPQTKPPRASGKGLNLPYT